MGLSELASHRSFVSPHHEMCDPSAPRHEMYDSSYPTEMPVSISCQRRDSPELLDPINSRSDRRSLWNRIHATPAIDPRYSTAEQSSNALLLGANESGNTISSLPGTRHTSIANSGPHDQHDRNSYAIFVETDILRESSDSSGASTESPRVETIISSSPRPKSLDLSIALPAPPQRKSQNLNRPFPLIPRSNNTPMSPTETSSSHRPSTLWNAVPANTLAHTADALASDAVSPSSPNSGLSSPFSYISPPISPIADSLFPPSNFVSQATGTREGQDIGTVEHLEDAASDWMFPSPSPSESVMRGLKHTRSASNTSELGLPRQRRVSHTAIFPAPGAQWTKDSVPQQHLHPIHDTYQSEELSEPSVRAQPYLSRMESSGLATSVHSSGIDELVESEAPSSMMESLIAQVATSFPSAFTSAPSVRYVPVDSSFMNESMETVRVGTSAPTFTPVDMNSNDRAWYKLPLSEGRPDAALWSRRQMIVPPLNLSRSNISSLGNKSGEANPRATSNQVSRQSQSREGQRSSNEIAGSGSDVASAHQRRSDLPTTLTSSPTTNNASHCFDHRSPLVTHSTSKQRQVEELLKLIGVVNDDWMQNLGFAPELRLRCNGQSPQVLFEKAILTLRECFCGRFPQTFEDVFAFIRVAFAVAFHLSCQQKFYDLDAFYEDALRWQHILSDQKDRGLFLKAIDCWCYLSEGRSKPLLESSRQTSFDSIYLQESLDCSDQRDLLVVLRDTIPFRAYVGFLDGKSILN